MPIYCPKCENEILPYLRTGELKQIVEHKQGKLPSWFELISYQLYWCVHCKIVYYDKYEEFEFLNLQEEIKKKQEENLLKKEKK